MGKKSLALEYSDKVIELYKQGKTTKELSLLFKVSTDTIRNILKLHNIERIVVKEDTNFVRYIYALIDPKTNGIKHVGISERFTLKCALSKTIRGNKRLKEWFDELLDSNLEPQLVYLEKVTKDKSREKKFEWINRINKTYEKSGVESFELNKAYKLSPRIVSEIRNKIAERSCTFRDIAKEYGISYQLVSAVAHNKYWQNNEECEQLGLLENERFDAIRNIPDYVYEIRNLYSLEGKTVQQIAKIYNLSYDTIRRIIVNESYHDAEYVYKKRGNKINIDIAREIRENVNSGKSMKQVSKEYNLAFSLIQAIIRNRIWKEK